MSRTGNPYDNAIAERFMRTLKYEEIYLNDYDTFGEVLRSVQHFIDDVYNHKRLHSARGYIPPAELRPRVCYETNLNCLCHLKGALQNVLLTNSSYRDIYALGSLQWGRSASLLFHIRDSAGKEIKPRAFPDDQTQVSPNDKSAFVKLLPNHFLGTEFFAPMEDLNLERSGKYTIFVEYKCPFSDSDVDLQPFWGSDWGVLKSNNLIIEVVR